MNSIEKTSFFILWDEVPPSDLQNFLQKNSQDSQAEFEVVTPPQNVRGMGPEALEMTLHVALITSLLGPLINNFFAEIRELRKEEREQQRKNTALQDELHLNFRVRGEKTLIRIKASDYPDNLPDKLEGKTTEDLVFLSVELK